jgi:hypothetical protein
MGSLKEVLGRHEERFDLKNMGFCFLAVVVLVAIIFGITNLGLWQKPAPEDTGKQAATAETR